MKRYQDTELFRKAAHNGGIREIAIRPINVMLNLFQHLIKSIGYETLKRVQGDKEVDFSNASNAFSPAR